MTLAAARTQSPSKPQQAGWGFRYDLNGLLRYKTPANPNRQSCPDMTSMVARTQNSNKLQATAMF